MENFRAFRGLTGTYNVRANEGISDPTQNTECIVHFLNDSEQKFIIDRRCKGQALLDSVFKHLNLIETDFFGLKYTPQDLQPNNRSNQAKVSQNNIETNNNTSTSNNNNIKNENTKSPATVKSCPVANSTPTTTTSKSSRDLTAPAIGDENYQGLTDNSARSPDKTPNNDRAPKSFSDRWLDPTKSIKKQCKAGPPYNFYFRVKFYVSDPCKLADDTTRYHLYQQLKLDIFNNRLLVPTCSAILLASYILQSEVGDYKPDLKIENDHVSKFRLLPNQSDDFNKKVIELHKQHNSLSPADAQHQFLEHAAKKLDCYGVEFHQAHDIQTDSDVRVGVSSSGIIVSRNNPIATSIAADSKSVSQLYSWAKILKIMFKKKIFSIQLRRDDHHRNSIISSIGGYSNTIGNFIEFSLLSNQACKSFWEECVAQHSFFRLHQPKSQPKKFFSFLNFGSKFQYNGKTEYQTMEESKKRSFSHFSHFSRAPSKRYARITIPIGRPSWKNEQDNPDKANISIDHPDGGSIVQQNIRSSKNQRIESNNNSLNLNANLSSTPVSSNSKNSDQSDSRSSPASGYRPKSLTLKSFMYIDESKGAQSTFDQLHADGRRQDGNHANGETSSISKLQMRLPDSDLASKKELKRCESLRLPSSIKGALSMTKRAGLTSGNQLAKLSESLRGKFLSTKASSSVHQSQRIAGESSGFQEEDDEEYDDRVVNLNDLDTSRSSNSETGSSVLKIVKLIPGPGGRYGFKIRKVTKRHTIRMALEGGGSKVQKFKRRSIIICDVSPDSPAATCDSGLHEGDEILSINEAPVEGLSESKVERMIKTTQQRKPPELVLEIRTYFTSRTQSADAQSLESQSGGSSCARRPNSENSTRTDTGLSGNVKPMTLAESIASIRKGLESKKLIQEFERLSRKKEDETLDESRLMENIDKNRYQDILPYDSTRVQLIDSMTGDYINASFVDMPVPSGQVNRYIATQGPLSSTCDDFWQMVWEQNSSLIIMVTPLVEAGRIKCHKYWPDEKEEIRHGQILVRNLNERSKTATIDRSIQLVDVKSGETRMTTQIQYKAWPDHEVPEDCGDFLKLINRVRKHRSNYPNDPIVVHCSAGIGRTGVLILMETAICFMECGEPVNPVKILDDMRRQRAMLIQTNSQFQFVADAISKVFDQKSYRKFCKLKKK